MPGKGFVLATGVKYIVYGWADGEEMLIVILCISDTTLKSVVSGDGCGSDADLVHLGCGICIGLGCYIRRMGGVVNVEQVL